MADKSDIEKMVDFCNKVKDIKKGKVVHETDCISIKYPHLDVDCHCFRHKSYVVHGKWFWEKSLSARQVKKVEPNSKL